MHDIQATLLTLLPSKRRSTSGGWISFDAVCCHHRGERPDTRHRGGVLFNSEGGFQYHCFNCQFKAGWTPGKLLSNNTKSLFRWMGMPDADINAIALDALRYKENLPVEKKALSFELKDIALPEGTMLLSEWIKEDLPDDLKIQFADVCEYVINRGFDPLSPMFMWTPMNGYADRVIIPFYQNKRCVGWTGRKIKEGKPKYLTESQNGYVFNIDAQTQERKFVIVVEGQFDALAIDGVAIMTNEPNETQIARIAALGREVIVVPDRDYPGSKLIKAAIKNSWSASLPPWENTIKDVADACVKYGRLYVLQAVLHYRVHGEIKLQLMKNYLENLKGINET